MLLTQGWKRQQDGSLVVSAIALSPCTNGMSGWQMHVGCYAPDRGETIQNATWTFHCATGSLASLLFPAVISEMMTWANVQQGEDLKAVLDQILVAVTDLAGKLPHDA